MIDKKTLYQHSTLATLVPGLLKGTLKMSELLQHGDTGIGTGEGLDGELIILDGQPYQVRSTGEVKAVSANFTVPFANAHFADFKSLFAVNHLAGKQLETQILAATHYQNIFFAVKVSGRFKKIQTRAVAKSESPYPTLLATAKAQKIFNAEDIEGTLISYYAPQLFNGVAVGGYHSHFLAAGYGFGGHVLDYTINDAEVQVQAFTTLEQHFPLDDPEFMAHDFAADNIANDIEQAEK
ncbi:acetolactate decarboxylase [Lapidilactobacillus bayanensis]|uniref:acetolactate decarboxylase n=1 Tax=Lapidilactobacillus bayanensis TaxID=2485998 RepID=UPI00177AB904|nr:acetolactate decarboxylase [Lapidilactobacillus bayanensis]